MNKKVHVKPYKRDNPKSKGSHQVKGHTRRINDCVEGSDEWEICKEGVRNQHKREDLLDVWRLI